MSFGEEITQLLMIIVALIMALMGINYWTKRGGTLSLPSMGSRSKQGSTEHPETGTNAHDVAEAHVEGAIAAKKKGSGGSAAERHGDRFNLTGKDAEAAARVLKRMLKQDKKFKDQSDHQ